MKEIDFLPEWYKNGIRRKVNYRVQYIIICGVFAVMMVWNFVSAGSVSKVRGKYLKMENMQLQSEKASDELEECKNEIAKLHEKEKVLDSTDSKINISNVLAELSYLVDERIVLSMIDMVSEIIPDNQTKGKVSRSMSVAKSSGSGGISDTTVGNVRFKIVIKGVAANGSDVAVLLCKLEDSPYFSHVNLAYSKDSQVNNVVKEPKSMQQNTSTELNNNQNENKSHNENINVNEFEINCYLSNYLESK